jgi:hypothetical protein
LNTIFAAGQRKLKYNPQTQTNSYYIPLSSSQNSNSITITVIVSAITTVRTFCVAKGIIASDLNKKEENSYFARAGKEA